jgi:hypothetical protein
MPYLVVIEKGEAGVGSDGPDPLGASRLRQPKTKCTPSSWRRSSCTSKGSVKPESAYLAELYECALDVGTASPRRFRRTRSFGLASSSRPLSVKAASCQKRYREVA